MYGEIVDFRCQHQQGNIKYSLRISIVSVNLMLKLFRVIVADADIGSLKSLRSFPKKYLYHMLAKFYVYSIF